MQRNQPNNFRSIQQPLDSLKKKKKVRKTRFLSVQGEKIPKNIVTCVGKNVVWNSYHFTE